MLDDSHFSHCWDILGGKSAEGFPDGVTSSESFFDRFQGNRLEYRNIILCGHGEMERPRGGGRKRRYLIGKTVDGFRRRSSYVVRSKRGDFGSPGSAVCFGPEGCKLDMFSVQVK